MAEPVLPDNNQSQQLRKIPSPSMLVTSPQDKRKIASLSMADSSIGAVMKNLESFPAVSQACTANATHREKHWAWLDHLHMQ
jgi:hypothetical protein